MFDRSESFIVCRCLDIHTQLFRHVYCNVIFTTLSNSNSLSMGTYKNRHWSVQFYHFYKHSVVPTRTGKPGKIGEHFPVRKKSRNFAKTGKVREFYTKYWKNLKKILLENCLKKKKKKKKKPKKVGEIFWPIRVKTPANMVPYFK